MLLVGAMRVPAAAIMRKLALLSFSELVRCAIRPKMIEAQERAAPVDLVSKMLINLSMNLATPANPNFKAKIRIKGKEYASASEMPAKIKEAYARAVGETALLRSGARLASKLNARIIINDKEFTNPGEMPVAERRLYQDTLAALLPSDIVLSTNDATKLRRKRALLTLLAISALAIIAHLWLRGFFG